MFKVVASQMIVPNMHLLTVEAPEVAQQVKPGQFVILRASEEGSSYNCSKAAYLKKS